MLGQKVLQSVCQANTRKRIGTWKLTIESAFLHLEDAGADKFGEADWFAHTLTPHPHSPGLTLTPSYTGCVFVHCFTHLAFVAYPLSARCFEFHTQSRPPVQERALSTWLWGFSLPKHCDGRLSLPVLSQGGVSS